MKDAKIIFTGSNPSINYSPINCRGAFARTSSRCLLVESPRSRSFVCWSSVFFMVQTRVVTLWSSHWREAGVLGRCLKVVRGSKILMPVVRSVVFRNLPPKWKSSLAIKHHQPVWSNRRCFAKVTFIGEIYKEPPKTLDSVPRKSQGLNLPWANSEYLPLVVQMRQLTLRKMGLS